jgi:hypothetical protein
MTDILVRLVSQPLSERLGQPFVIENRAGAASNIPTEAVVRAPADGYTLLGTDAAAAINATLYDNLGFNFVRDIAVVGIIRGPLLVTVHPSVPAKTVPEFITYAKANPGKISMASAGSGSPPHLAGELFKAMTNVDMTHVPYRGGGPAVGNLLGGQVQVYFGSFSLVIEHIQAKIQAKTIFATHYHELTELADLLPGIRNLHVTVKEAGNRIIFLRTVEAGPADRSYGIEVARLAGIPVTVTERAREILRKHEENEHQLSDNLTVRARRKTRVMVHQLPLFTAIEEELRNSLRALDLNNFTPMDALRMLEELRKKAQS